MALSLQKLLNFITFNEEAEEDEEQEQENLVEFANQDETETKNNKNHENLTINKNNSLHIIRYKLFVDMLFGEYLYALNC